LAGKAHEEGLFRSLKGLADGLKWVEVMKAFALTHIGRVRKRNEDRYVIRKMANGFFLFAVADGMGGEAAGDYAAEMMRERLTSLDFEADDRENALSQAVKDISVAIQNEGKRDPQQEGMGTTVTGALVRDGMAHYVHVGDTRIYLLHDKELIQVTRDQNWAQFLVDGGEITLEEAKTHALRNVLEQCVGCRDCEPEMGRFRVECGDMLMLSTDGLHGEVPTRTIVGILISDRTIEDKAQALITAALSTGGKDNITVVLAEIEE
jgi:PPM family protein phosphatase